MRLSLEDLKHKLIINRFSSSHRYCVFFIKDEKFITVEKLGGRDASYEEFLTDLQAAGEGECRYGLYDFEYEHQCQVGRERVRDIMWPGSQQILFSRGPQRAPRSRSCS